MPDRDKLLREAERCRRLARDITDEITKQRLYALARNYEAQAAAAGSSPDDNGQPRPVNGC
jgi:hypothetical protein